jgi:hypothetical protein
MLSWRDDAVELHPAFGRASGALLQQAFGLGLHVALDPLCQHAEKERREKIKPGAKHECPTPLHQQSLLPLAFAYKRVEANIRSQLQEAARSRLLQAPS